MPIVKERSNNAELEIQLQKLIGSYGGIEAFKKALPDLGIGFGQNQKDHLKKKLTVEQAIEEFFRGKHSTFSDMAETTKRTYKVEANLLFAFCKNHLSKGKDSFVCELITPENISAYLLPIKNMGTRNKKASFLRSFIKEVCRDQIEKDVLDKLFRRTLKIQECKNDLPEYFSFEQIEELLALAKRTQQGLRNHAILWTFIGSGIRLDEIKFKIGDILWDKQAIYVYPKRNKKEKKLRYISRNALEVLSQYVEFTYGPPGKRYTNEEYNQLFVFSGDGGKSTYSESTIQKMLRNLIRKAVSIPDDEKERFSVHSLRHTFAVHALLSGLNIYLISKYLGHQSLSSTEVYLKLHHNELINEMKKHPFANIDIDFLRKEKNI